MTRAVVFDLWNTLADWDAAEWDEMRSRIAQRLGLTLAQFDEAWYGELREMREMGPVTDALAHFDASPEVVEEFISMRREVARRGLVPVGGAVETIAELRRRGLLIGLITICSDEVPSLWSETAFHGLFDAEVFSCSVGLRKPDPRIYHLACEELGVAPEDALFVGDGDNDELAGAERVGMTAVLLERPEFERGWSGLRVRSLPEVLSLVEAPAA